MSKLRPSLVSLTFSSWLSTPRLLCKERSGPGLKESVLGGVSTTDGERDRLSAATALESLKPLGASSSMEGMGVSGLVATVSCRRGAWEGPPLDGRGVAEMPSPWSRRGPWLGFRDELAFTRLESQYLRVRKDTHDAHHVLGNVSSAVTVLMAGL